MEKHEVDIVHPQGKYRDEDRPSMDMGCMEFKGEADPIAYGQSGKAGCKSDEKKIHSQMKHYSW